jgi:hypothetical protein
MSDWSQQADSMIAKNRKGNLIVYVINDGSPVSNASVTVKQQSHDFWFGTAIHSVFGLIDSVLDTTGVDKMFQDTLRNISMQLSTKMPSNGTHVNLKGIA